MGGREVGGLANTLAAHMEFDNADHRRIVANYWRAPRLAQRPGLKAVDLFRAIEDGRVKAVWIMGTNPVDSMPEADRVRAALQACPFVVVSDVCEHTDTTRLAHVLLPSLAWGEKAGTVTNSERRISRQRPFLAALGRARADWQQMAEVARRMGFGAAFSYHSPAEIFREYAAMTALHNDGQRDLDLGGVAEISDTDYDTLAPLQWPRRVGASAGETRFFADGRFYHPDGKARFVATPFRAPANAVSQKWPFALNTGRVRNQWHTMTRTGKTPRLTAHVGEPFLEIHPRDAERLYFAEGELAEIESAHGSAVMRSIVIDRVAEGCVFAPMHWTDQFAARGRVDALISSATDPVSGQPELKFMPVAVRRFAAAWFAFVVSTRRPKLEQLDYFALSPTHGGYRAELAGVQDIDDHEAFARLLFTLEETAEIVAYRDQGTGRYRLAAFEADRLVGALFVARGPIALARGAICERLGKLIEPSERLPLLAGRANAKVRDKGAIVCACFEVGRNDIIVGARTGATSVAAIGEALNAGTNCGSCRGEIGKILRDFYHAAPPLAAAE